MRKGESKADILLAFSQGHGGIPSVPKHAGLSPQREEAKQNAVWFPAMPHTVYNQISANPDLGLLQEVGVIVPT